MLKKRINQYFIIMPLGLMLSIAVFVNCSTATKISTNFPIKPFDHELSGYLLNLDGSSVLDHPYRMHFNCSESGYYAIHYVPKNNKLQTYWRTEYFKENNYEYDDLDTENRLISQKLDSTIQNYVIFIYYLPMESLNATYGCTLETIEIKPNAMGYVYVKRNNHWQEIYTDQEPDIPIYYPSEYFTKMFPQYFK